jgi:hypothetical protein
MLADAQGLTIDVRSKVSDAGSSFAVNPSIAAGNGEKTSILVADDDTLGTAAFLVVVNDTDQVIFKHPIVIGES